jgi:hypothetical protein
MRAWHLFAKGPLAPRPTGPSCALAHRQVLIAAPPSKVTWWV